MLSPTKPLALGRDYTVRAFSFELGEGDLVFASSNEAVVRVGEVTSVESESAVTLGAVAPGSAEILALHTTTGLLVDKLRIEVASVARLVLEVDEGNRIRTEKEAAGQVFILEAPQLLHVRAAVEDAAGTRLIADRLADWKIAASSPRIELVPFDRPDKLGATSLDDESCATVFAHEPGDALLTAAPFAGEPQEIRIRAITEPPGS